MEWRLRERFTVHRGLALSPSASPCRQAKIWQLGCWGSRKKASGSVVLETHTFSHSLSHTHTCTQMYSHIPSLARACSHTHSYTHTAHIHNLIHTHTCSHTYVTKCSLHFLNLKSGRDRGYRNLKLAQSLLTGNRPCQTKADVCDVKNTGEGLGRWLSS